MEFGYRQPLKLVATIERWPLIEPFHITGYVWEYVDVLVVGLERGGFAGVAEAAGVYYRNDMPRAMLAEVESLRARVEAGVSRKELTDLIGPGGARNALDCALWDLEAKETGTPAWRIANLPPPRPIITTFTCGADDPDKMAAVASAYTSARAIKLKLTGEAVDAERVRAVRRVRPHVWLSVDANQGFTPSGLEELMPVLVEARVKVIEQPFPIGQEACLDGFRSPVPIAADESLQGLADLPALVDRFQYVNIKLDKCGGLTEALAIAREARRLGMGCMVGNMLGTSLAMAPAWILGQLCSAADLDGPMFLKADRSHPVSYVDGHISCSTELWG